MIGVLVACAFSSKHDSEVLDRTALKINYLTTFSFAALKDNFPRVNRLLSHRYRDLRTEITVNKSRTTFVTS